MVELDFVEYTSFTKALQKMQEIYGLPTTCGFHKNEFGIYRTNVINPAAFMIGIADFQAKIELLAEEFKNTNPYTYELFNLDASGTNW